ncbi:MAG: sialidase family protein [Thermoguttaceae bacterium]
MKLRIVASAVVLLCVTAVAGTVPLRALAAPEPDHSRVPGVVVAHSPAASGIYIGSPGIIILPDGTYLAKHDEFGPRSTERTSAVTHVYRSADRGASWEHLAKVDGLFWANIFHHQGAVYMMGTSAGHGHGHCVIRRSTDGGRTWTEAEDENTGLLFPDLSYATAPMQVVIHNGRIWRTMEDEQGGDRWGHSFRAFMMSAPVDADLLAASNWTSTNAIARDPSWLGGRFGGWLEGNAVVDPEGRIVNILRVAGLEGKAAFVRISEDGKKASFDPETGFIDLPGGTKKFLIRRDPRSGTYWALSNPAIGGSVRNTLALMHSEDLIDWDIRCILLHHPDPVYHAFQYPDWVFDGDDILVASRTAYDDGIGGSRRAHDANYLTFHRFDKFRERTLADSAVHPEDIGRAPRVTVELGAATVEGRGLTIQTLRNGAVSFANRKYLWEDVPEELQGWHYTQTGGGEPPHMKATARRDTTLYLATATCQPGIDTTGWEPAPDLKFRYTDGGRTRMDVFRRSVKAGESIDIPQGNWTGGLLLAPPAEEE